jgi:vitamin B12 transporter
LADQLVSEPYGNTLTVESNTNPISAQVSVALPEVVVTANRLDTPISQVPNSITVITAQDIEKKQSATAMEALQNVPGLILAQSGGPGEIASIYTRGSGDGDTLVLMDGIPLNNPVGTARSYDYLDQLALGGVRQIEVVRGPQSVLYGTNAMAGVINIITQMGSGPASGSVLVEGGSYGTVRQTASVEGGDTKCDYALSTSYYSTAGFPTADKAFGNSLNNPYDDLSSLFHLETPLASNFREEVLVNYNQSRINIDDGAGSASGDPIMDDPNGWIDQKQVLVGSKTSWTLGDWEQSLTLSFMDNYYDGSDIQSAESPNSYTYADSYDGQSGKLTWQNNLKISPEETLVLGLEGNQEWGNSPSSSGSTTIQNSQWEESGFLESLAKLDVGFFLNVGGRLDNYNVYGTHGTYQAGAAYFIPSLETKLKATYGTGFLAPTLYQLYDPTHGNLSLQPESNTSYDLGLEQPFWEGQVRVGATYFHNDFENQITYYGTNSNGIYGNSGSFQTEGVETFVAFKLGKVLTLKGSYTYTDVETSIPVTLAYSPLLQKPSNQAGFDVDYQSGPVEAEVSGTYVGQRPDVDFYGYYISPAYAPIPVTLSDYFLLNLRASCQINSTIKLFARVDNLFNQFYEEVYGYGTPGVSGYIGTKISF